MELNSAFFYICKVTYFLVFLKKRVWEIMNNLTREGRDLTVGLNALVSKSTKRRNILGGIFWHIWIHLFSFTILDGKLQYSIVAYFYKKLLIWVTKWKDGIKSDTAILLFQKKRKVALMQCLDFIQEPRDFSPRFFSAAHSIPCRVCSRKIDG